MRLSPLIPSSLVGSGPQSSVGQVSSRLSGDRDSSDFYYATIHSIRLNPVQSNPIHLTKEANACSASPSA